LKTPDHARGKEHDVVHVDAADPSFQMTKADARSLTKRIAHGLRHNFGIGASGPGKDIVLGVSSGQHLLPTAFYGVVAAEGVYSAASASFTATELARQIKDGPAKAMITSADIKDVAAEAAKLAGLPLSRVLVMESKPKASLRSVDGSVDCLPQAELDWKKITDPKELWDSSICLLYSSGTTGVPKGQTRHIVQCCYNIESY
jgi:4-coumarate--CoA ligase